MAACLALVFHLLAATAWAERRYVATPRGQMPTRTHPLYVLAEDTLHAVTLDVGNEIAHFRVMADSVRSYDVRHGRDGDEVFVKRDRRGSGIQMTVDGGRTWKPVFGNAKSFNFSVSGAGARTVLWSSFDQAKGEILYITAEGGRDLSVYVPESVLVLGLLAGKGSPTRYYAWGMRDTSAVLLVCEDPLLGWRDQSSRLPAGARMYELKELGDGSGRLVISTSVGIYMGDPSRWTRLAEHQFMREFATAPSGTIYGIDQDQALRVAAPPHRELRSMPGWPTASGRFYHTVAATDSLIVLSGFRDLALKSAAMDHFAEVRMADGRAWYGQAQGAAPPPGSLKVVTTPPGARLDILTAEAPPAPILSPTSVQGLHPGSLDFVAGLPGYRTQRRTVQVADDRVVDVTVALEPDPSFAMDYGGEFQGHRYWVARKPGGWRAAQAMCAAGRGHLVAVDSAAENKFVAGMLTRLGRPHGWLGVVITAGDLVHINLLSGSEVQYDNWAKGEPELSLDEEGGEGVWIDAGGRWYEQSRTTRSFGILEFP
jgi:hypothetical protein